ncbi:MAG: dihydroorotase, partial [Celeribacter marinus]
NETTITLTKGDPVPYPAKITTPDGPLTLFDPQMPLHWSVEA